MCEKHIRLAITQSKKRKDILQNRMKHVLNITILGNNKIHAKKNLYMAMGLMFCLYSKSYNIDHVQRTIIELLC